MLENKHCIYKTLDNPPRVLYWPIDEFLIMVSPIFFGIVFGSFILMLGAFIKMPYTRLKNSLNHRSISHYIYWHLPTCYLHRLGHFKCLPKSNLRVYLL